MKIRVLFLLLCFPVLLAAQDRIPVSLEGEWYRATDTVEIRLDALLEIESGTIETDAKTKKPVASVRWPNSLGVRLEADDPRADAWKWGFGTSKVFEGATALLEVEEVGKHPISLTLTYPDGSIAVLASKGEVLSVKPIFTHDAIVLGLLLIVLGLIFYTSSKESGFWKKFYTYVPPLLLCYFVPAFLNWPLHLIHEDYTYLYNPVTSRYLLPASLVLLTLSIDFKGIIGLGPKALIMFLTATVGIVIGGPIALLAIAAVAPDVLGADASELWKGLSTIAGSWIGGGANQTAMKEIFEVSDRIFASMVVVDVVVANIWMGFLLYGASISDRIDGWFKADSSAINDLKQRVENYSASIAKIPTTTDFFLILAIGFGATALAHWGAQLITPLFDANKAALAEMGLSSLTSPFFWLIVLATTIGMLLSLTPARKLEGAGASKIGSVFIYLLVASIGMKMNIGEVFDNLGAFFVGIVWMIVHVSLLLGVGKLIRAPFFFTAVGSQANVGGAASAPIVASAFSPALAPVGVLLAVLGYALGTYGALLCAFLMETVSKGLG